jgi:hypothetical protein
MWTNLLDLLLNFLGNGSLLGWENIDWSLVVFQLGLPVLIAFVGYIFFYIMRG